MVRVREAASQRRSGCRPSKSESSPPAGEAARVEEDVRFQQGPQPRPVRFDQDAPGLLQQIGQIVHRPRRIGEQGPARFAVERARRAGQGLAHVLARCGRIGRADQGELLLEGDAGSARRRADEVRTVPPARHQKPQRPQVQPVGGGADPLQPGQVVALPVRAAQGADRLLCLPRGGQREPAPQQVPVPEPMVQAHPGPFPHRSPPSIFGLNIRARTNLWGAAPTARTLGPCQPTPRSPGGPRRRRATAPSSGLASSAPSSPRT